MRILSVENAKISVSPWRKPLFSGLEGTQNHQQIVKNPLKERAKKKHYFLHPFLMNFDPSGDPLGAPWATFFPQKAPSLPEPSAPGRKWDVLIS